MEQLKWRRLDKPPVERNIVDEIRSALVKEKEAMGYILGMGFSFRAKPDSFASSSCANKVVQ